MGAFCICGTGDDELDDISSIVSFEFVMIADQDKESKSDDESERKWISYLQFGNIQYDKKDNKLITFEYRKPSSIKDRDDFKGEFDDMAALVLSTNIGTEKGRGAEFSALCKHKEQNVLYTGDDRSGLIYQIDDDFKLNVIGKLIEKKETGELMYIASDELNDENIDDSGFKIEWMAFKDGVGLFIGSTSVEHYDFETRKVTPARTWIAQIGSQLQDTNTLEWIQNYNALRRTVGTVFPGWMSVECVIYSNIHKLWYILPRFASINAPFDALLSNYGSNLMLIASEDFKEIRYVDVKLEKPKDNNEKYVDSLYTNYDLVNTADVKVNVNHDFEGAKRIGIVTKESMQSDELEKLQKEVSNCLYYSTNGAKGFSCATFVPETNEKVIMAIRVLENDKGLSSSLCIFDVDGNVFVDEYPLRGNRKYEGIQLFMS